MRPTYKVVEHTYDPNHYSITIIPPSDLGVSSKTIVVDEEDYQAFIAWKNGEYLIQDAFPHWSADDRELLLTGLSEEEWNAIMKEQE